MTSSSSLNTYSERRKIREEIQRLEQEGVSLDPAIKCRCACGNVHYKLRGSSNGKEGFRGIDGRSHDDVLREHAVLQKDASPNDL
jgi:hypothetical protein